MVFNCCGGGGGDGGGGDGGGGDGGDGRVKLGNTACRQGVITILITCNYLFSWSSPSLGVRDESMIH